jgi:hypothetical protein
MLSQFCEHPRQPAWIHSVLVLARIFGCANG